jgi:hypothetical protein
MAYGFENNGKMLEIAGYLRRWIALWTWRRVKTDPGKITMASSGKAWRYLQSTISV